MGVIAVEPGTLYVTVAPAARGKSTLVRDFPGTVLSTDDLRAQWCPTHPCHCTGQTRPDCDGGQSCRCQNPRVFAEIARRATDALRAGQAVLIDATSLNPAERRNHRESATPAGAVSVALLAVALPLGELLRRNASRPRRVPSDVIESMAAQHAGLTVPDLLAEGFTRVVVWDDETRFRPGP